MQTFLIFLDFSALPDRKYLIEGLAMELVGVIVPDSTHVKPFFMKCQDLKNFVLISLANYWSILENSDLWCVYSSAAV